jgi:hypothetical protein
MLLPHSVAQLVPVLASPTGEGAKASPLGLVVILLLCVACYFLFRSMSRHLRRVREDFPTASPPSPTSTERPEEPSADDPS